MARMIVLVAAALCLAAAILTAATNWLALIPWRRAGSAHWTERARLLNPARVGANINGWALPVILVAVAQMLFPQPVGWLLVEWISATIGTTLGSWFFSRATIPWLTPRLWWEEAAVVLSTRALHWALFAAVTVNMPSRLDWTAVPLAGVAVAYDLWLVFGGMARVFLWLGVIRDAPERVQRLVGESCERMGVARPAVWACASSTCNAYALIWARALLFTDVLVERLD